MNKVELLIIRACKSADPHKKVEQVFNKLYYSQFDYKHLSGVLLGIVEKYNLISTRNLIDGLNPKQTWKYCAEGAEYYEQVAKFFISEVRLTEVSKFPIYPVPAKMRKEEN